MIVASDYNYGLLFWKLKCSDITDTCKVKPVYRVRTREVGSLAVLHPDNLKEEKVVFT